MTTYYSKNPKFYVSVDCIIFGFNEGELNLLLLKRNFQPAMGEWSLMGGFVQEDESVDDAAKRVLHELTGLDNVYMEQVGSFGAIGRDPGERVVSIAYYSLININEYDKELVQKHNAFWVNINELPELIFDHPQMVAQARKLMQQKASTEPIGFNLLPKLFTLSQLQSLYLPFLPPAPSLRHYVPLRVRLFPTRKDRGSLPILREYVPGSAPQSVLR